MQQQYDYSALSPEIAAEAKAEAERVHARGRQSVESVIEDGKAFARMKWELPSGQFGPWCAIACRKSKRSVERAMRAAAFAGTKTTGLSLLCVDAFYLVSRKSMPKHVVDRVIGQLDAGYVPTEREIRAWLGPTKQKPATLSAARFLRSKAWLRLSPAQQRAYVEELSGELRSTENAA